MLLSFTLQSLSVCYFLWHHLIEYQVRDDIRRIIDAPLAEAATDHSAPAARDVGDNDEGGLDSMNPAADSWSLVLSLVQDSARNRLRGTACTARLSASVAERILGSSSTFCAEEASSSRILMSVQPNLFRKEMHLRTTLVVPPASVIDFVLTALLLQLSSPMSATLTVTYRGKATPIFDTVFTFLAYLYIQKQCVEKFGIFREF